MLKHSQETWDAKTEPVLGKPDFAGMPRLSWEIRDLYARLAYRDQIFPASIEKGLCICKPEAYGCIALFIFVGINPAQ